MFSTMIRKCHSGQFDTDIIMLVQNNDTCWGKKLYFGLRTTFCLNL